MPTYPTYKLSDVADILDSSRKPINSTERTKRIQGKTENELYPYYGATGQVGLIDEYLTDGEYVLVGEDGAPFLEPFKNKSYIIRGKAWVNNHAHILSGKKDVLSNQYLNYFLNSFDYRNYVNGTTRLKLTQGNLTQIPIPLPPLATQHAIVTRIETLFAELDKAVQHLRTAQQQLKTYRQAVLKVAFEECENTEKHLFGEIMADIRNGYGAKPTDSGSYKLLRISSVRAMNLNLDDYRFNNSSFDEKDIIKENDLLFTRYNGSVDLVGVCAYVPKLNDTYAYPDKIIRCRPKTNDTFHSKFLQYYINQGKAREFVRSKIKTTSGQNGISGSDIKKIEIPLPPLTKQQRIVKEIESRLSQATASETYIENALQQAEALRQSILKKAFSGELV